MLFKIIFKNKMLFKIEDNKRTDLKYEETDVKWRYLQTWEICLKSDIAFINPRLSTLAVMKKHSQINEKFSFFEHLTKAVLSLPELVASCDSTKRAPPLELFWSHSLFMLSIQDETSSDEAFIAVKSLQ